MKYTNELKLKMIKEKRKDKLNPKEIFKKFGIEVKDKADDYERKTLRGWERKLERMGGDKFLESGSGRKKKILPKNWEEVLERMPEKEQLEWLKHKTVLMEK